MTKFMASSKKEKEDLPTKEIMICHDNILKINYYIWHDANDRACFRIHKFALFLRASPPQLSSSRVDAQKSPKAQREDSKIFGLATSFEMAKIRSE